jgi:hypothetical protein
MAMGILGSSRPQLKSQCAFMNPYIYATSPRLVQLQAGCLPAAPFAAAIEEKRVEHV